VDVCGRATKASTSGRQVGIGLNYGCLISTAYGNVGKNGTGPGTGCNASCEAAGIATFTARLKMWRAGIDDANTALGFCVPVVAVMFDCETFTVGSFDVIKNGQVAIGGVTRHNELMFNATRAVFPSTNTTILNYDYGQAEWWPHHDRATVRAVPGRLSAISLFLCKSGLYGAFVCARRALNSQKRWYPARAGQREVERRRPVCRDSVEVLRRQHWETHDEESAATWLGAATGPADLPRRVPPGDAVLVLALRGAGPLHDTRALQAHGPGRLGAVKHP
jgi:hypothetical protein